MISSNTPLLRMLHWRLQNVEIQLQYKKYSRNLNLKEKVKIPYLQIFSKIFSWYKTPSTGNFGVKGSSICYLLGSRDVRCKCVLLVNRKYLHVRWWRTTEEIKTKCGQQKAIIYTNLHPLRGLQAFQVYKQSSLAASLYVQNMHI